MTIHIEILALNVVTSFTVLGENVSLTADLDIYGDNKEFDDYGTFIPLCPKHIGSVKSIIEAIKSDVMLNNHIARQSGSDEINVHFPVEMMAHLPKLKERFDQIGGVIGSKDQ